MDIRPYEPRDRAACLNVLDSLNSSARPPFESWLDQPEGPYFVMEHEEAVVGCGGYSLSPDGTIATLRWGIVRPNSQKMGLGRFLLMYRIREIGKAGTVSVVLAHPPRLSVGFFEKQGFRVNAIVKDAHVDRIEMIKKLTVCP